MKKLRIVLLLQLIGITFFLCAADDKEPPHTIPQKIMFYQPGKTFTNTVENSVYYAAESVLQELAADNRLLYADESQYHKFMDLYDLNDPYKLSDFYTMSGISASLDCVINQEERGYRVVFLLNLFIEGTTSESICYLRSEQFVLGINQLKQQLASFLTAHLPLFSIIELKKLKVPKELPLLRINPDLSILSTWGIGVHGRIITENDPIVFGVGPSLYTSGFLKIHHFYLSASVTGSSILTNPVEDIASTEEREVHRKLDETFSLIPEIRSSFTLGGLIPNEIFGMGVGGSYCHSAIYVQTEHYDNYYYVIYHKEEYTLLYFYLNFLFKPYSNVYISFDVGSYLSPDHLDSIYPSPFFLMYVNASIKYCFYKDLFFELAIPFNMINYDFSGDGYGSGRPVTDFAIEAALGWRFNRSFR